MGFTSSWKCDESKAKLLSVPVKFVRRSLNCNLKCCDLPANLPVVMVVCVCVCVCVCGGGGGSSSLCHVGRFAINNLPEEDLLVQESLLARQADPLDQPLSM